MSSTQPNGTTDATAAETVEEDPQDQEVSGTPEISTRVKVIAAGVAALLTFGTVVTVVRVGRRVVRRIRH